MENEKDDQVDLMIAKENTTSPFNMAASSKEQYKQGEKISNDEIKPGDLVFFGNTKPSHVAIYMGNGRIIHCSQMVRTNSLKKGDEDFYDRQILCVRRIK